jgi:hypothetical protein
LVIIIRQSGGLFAQFVRIVGFAVLIIASQFPTWIAVTRSKM